MSVQRRDAPSGFIGVKIRYCQLACNQLSSRHECKGLYLVLGELSGQVGLQDRVAGPVARRQDVSTHVQPRRTPRLHRRLRVHTMVSSHNVSFSAGHHPRENGALTTLQLPCQPRIHVILSMRIKIWCAIDWYIHDIGPGWERCVRHVLRYVISTIYMTHYLMNMPSSRLQDWQPSGHDNAGPEDRFKSKTGCS